MYDLIIVGGGPAAAAAAVYALGKQLDFLAIYAEPGKAGRTQQLAGESGLEFLPGAEAVRLFERQVVAHEGRALRDQVTSVTKEAGIFRVATKHHGVRTSAAVIVATGATPIALDVPGARRLIGWGLGYSVTTHAHLLAGKRVAVIGATVRALRGLAELARTAEQVYHVVPEAASLHTPLGYALRRRQNVETLAGYEVVEVVGKANLEQLVLARGEETRRLSVDAAFVDLGLVPNSGIVRQLAKTDQDGFIGVDDRNATTTPGLFAAGDVTTAFGEQIMIAIGDGARAALSAYDYLLANQPVLTEPVD